MQILLIDDHTLFRKGLALLIQELDQDVSIVEAESADHALSLADTECFDLVLLDLYLAGESGLTYLEPLKEAFQVPVVMLSSEDKPEVVKRCIDQGAAGFIPKSSTPQVLIAAMQLILADGIYLPPNVLGMAPVASSTRAHTETKSDSPLSNLSARQIEVLKKAIMGKANKVIARELDLSEGTVKAHMSAAYRALGVKNRSEAVFTAARYGLKINAESLSTDGA